ncbi:MAG TPA: M20/M25/M40 family metallo-hydrolase [Clostridia bacterium]|nr:M20/M25/M40 family metallo-hydrolase [Clostridia bacterium]
MKNKTYVIQKIIFILVITFTSVLSVYQTSYLPDINPSSASQTSFSAERSMKHIEIIADKPHATGSAQIETVRKYIMGELSKLGLKPETQSATMNNRQVFASSQNIIARMEGTENRSAVLLVSHYDTVSSTPGASDDTIGVATLLETARALKSGAPMKNSIIFLFTDAEETGLLGAYAFIKEHRWAKDVKFVVNLDAGGISGPAYLVDTSAHNKRIISEYAKTTSYPIGNGAGQAFGSSGSDFNAFKSAGYPGLYIALARNARIHTSLDSISNFNNRSLQHMGDTALSIMQRFGSMDLDLSEESDACYFNLFGGLMLYYPVTWVIPAMIFIFLLLSAVICIGFKKGILSVKGIIFGVITLILSISISSIAVLSFWKIISGLCPAYSSIIGGHANNEEFLWVAFICITILITAILYNLVLRHRKADIPDLTIGAMSILTFGMVLLSVYKPMSSYILVLPLFFNLIATGYWFYSRGNQKKTLSAFQLILFLISAAVTINLFVPPIYAGYMASETSRDFVFSIFITIMVGLLLPHIFTIKESRRWIMPVAALLVLLVSTGTIIAFGFDKHQTQPCSAFYILDADSGKSYWGGGIPGNKYSPDEWTQQLFPKGSEKCPIGEYIKDFPYNYDFYVTNAPKISLEAPQIKLIDKKTDGEIQTLHLYVKSLRKATRLEVYLGKGQKIISTEVDGKIWTSLTEPTLWGPENAVLFYNALPEEGIDIIVKIQSNRPAKLIFMDRTYGIPKVPGTSDHPVPEYVVKYGYASPLCLDTIIMKTVEL